MAHYTVRRGESLSGIARRFGTSWQELARLNGLKDPDRLRVGQKLLVSAPLRPAARSAARPASASARRSPAPKQRSLLDSAMQEAREAWDGVRTTINGWLTPARDAPQPRPATRQPVAKRAIAVAGDVTEAQLRAIMPDAGARTARFIGPLNQAMRTYGINTNERRAAFLAQISAESGQLRHTEENLNYSAERLRVVWPKRFPTAALARPMPAIRRRSPTRSTPIA